jgi:putative transcriptional regulator
VGRNSVGDFDLTHHDNRGRRRLPQPNTNLLPARASGGYNYDKLAAFILIAPGSDMADHEKSLAGHFLVASRYLRDPNFVRSVVLMIHHNDEGAMGVVINRPSEKTVREVWEMIGNDPVQSEDRIFVGGPVPGPLVCIHDQEAFSEHQVLPGLFVATHRDALDLIVRKSQHAMRLYSGHAGWGSGQLEGELEAGGWLSTRASKVDVFADHETIWKTVTQRIGLEIMAPDASMN